MNNIFSFQIFAEYSTFFLILIIFIYFLHRFDQYIQSYIDQENKKKLKNKKFSKEFQKNFLKKTSMI